MKILVLNAGSSSLKYQVLDTDTETTLHSGAVEGIGLGEGSPRYREAIAGALDSLPPTITLEAVGHRVVHGGEKFSEPIVITAEVEEHIRDISSLAPLHNPANLQGIQAAREALPNLTHVAVFDTAFHHTLPKAASTLALPEDIRVAYGIRKYGFHGTSHHYVSKVASELLGGDPLEHKVISLHLGNGSSATALRGGRSLDTSMSFTPTSGLVMGSRPGDLDPAVVTHLLEQGGYTLEEVTTLLSKNSGLKGLTGHSDFREITALAAAGDDTAVLALDVWAWRIKHYIGAYAALLGGLDAVVFTGGIGENSAEGRLLATQGLDFLGVTIDPYLNSRPNSHTRTISPPTAQVSVYVIPTQEELEIARQTAVLISSPR
jgi:acetate kinase